METLRSRSRNPHLRPSGTPPGVPASHEQRGRARGGRIVFDHAARASGGLLLSRGSRPGASYPWSAR